MSPDGSPLRILHAPIEIAGQVGTLVAALRRLGHDAEGVTYLPDRYAFGGLAPAFPRDLPPGPKQLAELRLVRRALSFDVLHFHGGVTLFARNLDLLAYKWRRVPAVAHFWGDEARLARIAVRDNPWIAEYIEPRRDAWKERRLRRLARRVSTAVVGDHELRPYVEGTFDRVEIVPQAIDLNAYPPSPPAPNTPRPVVVHAPSDTEIKGTRHVREAVDRLRARRNLRYVEISGRTHAEAVATLAQADVVVDQLLVGSHGVLAVEAMALGKPVVGYIREDLREKYPPDLPIVTATPETVETELDGLLADGVRRRRLGEAGRRYAERHHDALAVASRLVDVYRSLVP